VDHPCSKCGVTVQDGIAFCPNCGAPQIRVANPFGDTPVTPPMPPGTPGDIQPPAEPVAPWPAQQQGFRSPMQYDWRAGWRSAITAGVVIGILSSAPYVGGVLCCLWTLGGGAIAAFLYQRNSDQFVVPLSLGFRTGLLTGLVAYAVNLLAFLAQLFAGRGAEIRRHLAEQMQKSISESGADAQTAAAFQRFVESIQTPEGFAIIITLSLVMLGIGFVLFTGLGALLGVSILRRNRH
jgi:hypothetical protein